MGPPRVAAHHPKETGPGSPKSAKGKVNFAPDEKYKVTAEGQGASAGGVSKKRYTVADKRAIEEIMVKEGFKELDKKNKGVLTRDLLKELMTNVNRGVEPTETEIEFIFRSGGQNDGKAETISMNDVLHGVKIWRTQLEMKGDVDRIFAKYDPENTGELDHEKLKLFLVDMNEGEPVLDSEVEWVMSKADVLGTKTVKREELMNAVSAWYTHVEVKEAKKKSPLAKLSKVCVVQ
jgi:Ca2+-binding EF-hand superfamily protein